MIKTGNFKIEGALKYRGGLIDYDYLDKPDF